MRVLDIALKDLLRNLRNGTMVFTMFLLPLLTNGLLYFAFGGIAGGDGGFDLQVTQVQVVNLDEAPAALGGFSAGQMLVGFLQDETLADLIEVAIAVDEQGARTAVDQQEAGVAVFGTRHGAPRALRVRGGEPLGAAFGAHGEAIWAERGCSCRGVGRGVAEDSGAGAGGLLPRRVACLGQGSRRGRC